MIGAFFFYGGGKTPGRIKKIKEWKVDKNKAFDILNRTAEGDISLVRRLIDGKEFVTNHVLVNSINGERKMIKKFHFDCINVDIRSYKYSDCEDGVVRTEKTIHINEFLI